MATGWWPMVGLHALGAFADRLGLGDALSAAVPPTGERLPVHDRGKVLCHTMLRLAGGGECCADVETLRRTAGEQIDGSGLAPGADRCPRSRAPERAAQSCEPASKVPVRGTACASGPSGPTPTVERQV